MNFTDPYNLQRFVDAQESTFEQALDELRRGRKETHWMWFIFPQLAALGRSSTAQYYGIHSLDEARAYLDHPVLGPCLANSVGALLPWGGQRDAEQIFGPVDAMKLRSSLTLFGLASSQPTFGRALDAFFKAPDERTLALLRDEG